MIREELDRYVGGMRPAPTLLQRIAQLDPDDVARTKWEGKKPYALIPGEIATVTMKFDPPNLPTSEMRDAVSPRTGGREYVWTAISSNTKSMT